MKAPGHTNTTPGRDRSVLSVHMRTLSKPPPVALHAPTHWGRIAHLSAVRNSSVTPSVAREVWPRAQAWNNAAPQVPTNRTEISAA
eukprot:15478664-Alexandrium_andersonii.AAC.1